MYVCTYVCMYIRTYMYIYVCMYDVCIAMHYWCSIAFIIHIHCTYHRSMPTCIIYRENLYTLSVKIHGRSWDGTSLADLLCAADY